MDFVDLIAGDGTRVRRYAAGRSPQEKEAARRAREQRQADMLARAQSLGIDWTEDRCGQDPDTPHIAPEIVVDQMPECRFCGASLHGCESCGPADGYIRWSDERESD